MNENKKIRVLIGKCGCDIHERGALTLLNVFRDYGMEVIYTGRYQTEAGVVNAAVTEDVDVIALSDLTGSLPIIAREVLNGLKQKGAEDIIVVCGGLITGDDKVLLDEMGVAASFGTGSPSSEAAETIIGLVNEKNASKAQRNIF
jgi:methylmalonyl-CoA mutase C-terminal domain/subunit